MYNFVKQNKSSPYASHVHDYLKTLKSKGYKDCAQLYKDMYGWKLNLVAVNSNSSDYTTKASSVTRYTSYLHFNFELQGGPPGEKITMYHTITWPSGYTNRADWTWDNISRGRTFGCEWPNGPYATSDNPQKGYLTIKVYNKATGELLGSGSILLL